jgi:hypothetical protein
MKKNIAIYILSATVIILSLALYVVTKQKDLYELKYRNEVLNLEFSNIKAD